MTGAGTRYVSLKKIADGGMAEIFLARQSGAEGFTRPVILKRILPATSVDPQFRDMLIDEAHVAMGLHHGNIVPVVDLGEAGGRYFLVMELVDGWDLAAIVRRARKADLPIPLGLALYMMAEVCRGLGYAHAHTGPDGKPLGIVHRDVSPQNVLVSEQGEVKVTDFGIAKVRGKRDRTEAGVIKGKLDFMSPEQASGEPLAASSDVFAVGTMLYLLATGSPPFAAPSDLELLLKVRRGEFVPPSKLRPGLPRHVVRIVEKAMSRSPGARYPSGEAMMLEIEKVLRSDFRSAGQSELKQWLAELGRKDGAPSTMNLPALPVVEAPATAGGATETLTLEETEIVSAFAQTRMQDSATTTVPQARPASRRGGRAPWSRGLRWGFLLALLAGTAFGATQLLPARGGSSLGSSVVEGARGLLRRTDLASFTQAATDRLSLELPGTEAPAPRVAAAPPRAAPASVRGPVRRASRPRPTTAKASDRPISRRTASAKATKSTKTKKVVIELRRKPRR